MSDFYYYKSKEIYREKYYQMPKVFFTNQKYTQLSNDAKIAYMLLKDRFDYSVANNWVDDEDNIFFIFTVSELMKILNCREGKVSKIKKELEQVDLLRQKKGRLNKSDGSLKTTPNLLYLGKPEVSATDVFKLNNLEKMTTQTNDPIDSTVIANIANTVESNKNGNDTVIANIANTVEPNKNGNDTVIANIADNLSYSNPLDTNRHLIDTEKDALQDQLLLDNFVEIMKDDSIATFIPKKVLTLIKVFSLNYADAQQTVRTIHNAKRKAEQLSGVTIVFEDLDNYGIEAESRLYSTLLKAYQKQKTEKVENIQNLIFAYIKNWFVEYVCAAIQALETDQTLPKVSMVNWLQAKENKTQRSES